MELDAGLKKAIKDSGMTHYRIGKLSGVNPGMIDRFMSGERGLQFTTAAKIAVALGYGLAKIAEPATDVAAKKKKAP